MKYLILLLSCLMLIGCCEDPSSQIWKYKEECHKLGDMMKSKVVHLTEKESVVNCKLVVDKDYEYQFSDREILGALRGIRLNLNLEKIPPLKQCWEDMCKKLEDQGAKSHIQYVCYRKCKRKVKWID